MIIIYLYSAILDHSRNVLSIRLSMRLYSLTINAMNCIFLFIQRLASDLYVKDPIYTNIYLTHTTDQALSLSRNFYNCPTALQPL